MVVGSATEKGQYLVIAYNSTTDKAKNKDNKTSDVKDNTNCLIKGKPDLYQPMDGDERGWEKSAWPNGGVFNCIWSPENVIFRDGILMLDLTRNRGGKLPYTSGEFRTKDGIYTFGYYETRMKATKGPGLVAGTFFTYAGDWGQANHNEIDFEVLGKEPTKVQINYYYAGSGKSNENERHIDLGFDASEDYHNYGFIWNKDSIEWYIDGKRVYTATQNIPQDPCKIMVNFWPGTQEVSGWLGGVYAGNGGQVSYDWIKFKKLDPAATTIQPKAENTLPSKADKPKKAGSASSNGTKLKGLLGIAFNGAGGSKMGENKVTFSGKGYDQGMVLFQGEPLKGKLTFKYSGEGPVKVLFINGGSNISYQIVEDANQGTEKTASIEIPAGTNKINIMAAGSQVDIVLSDFVNAK